MTDRVLWMRLGDKMPRFLRPLRRKFTIPLLVLYLFGIGAARKVEEYAGAPHDEKDCPLRADGRTLSAGAFTAFDQRKPLIPLAQEGGTLNDASCLNRTRVYGVVAATTEDQIREGLLFAREQGLRVSIGGVRHSMGGQALFRDALVLDMRGYKKLALDEENGVLNVQSGATWRDVLEYLHPRGLSVRAMQGIDILTVGGSVAVNAHGIDHRSGSMASSIRSMRVMLADGTVHRVDRSHEPELFRSVIGGYGLFGVILDVELELAENETYRFEQRIIDSTEFPTIFRDEIDGNDDYRLMYVHLSTDPGTYLREAILYTYRAAEDYTGTIPPLREPEYTRGARFVLNLAKTGSFGQRLKWFAQKRILPFFRQCYVSRNDAVRESEACLVSRNQAMSVSLDALKNKLGGSTDILQEYFVPRDRIVPFLDAMREVLESNNATLLNSTIRVVHEEDILLNYAKEDVFAVVLYLNQEVSAAGNAKMARVTRELIDAAAAQGGTFYLPYQLHYSRTQLERAYPEIGSFFALKRKYDPMLTFMNHFYAAYADDSSAPAGSELGYHAANLRLPEPVVVGQAYLRSNGKRRVTRRRGGNAPRAPPIGSPRDLVA